MSYIAEFLLYICFAILMGNSILQLIAVSYKPTIAVPKWLIIACIIGIPLFAYAPLHTTAISYADSFQLSYGAMIKSILLDLQIGKGWVWMTFGSLGLAIIMGAPIFAKDRHMPKVAFLLILLIAFWLGYGSHTASLDAVRGLIVHTGHFLAVSIWLGILFVVSWFSKDELHWQAFLKWFSPLAIVCVLVAIIAGITLMSYTVPEYNNALMLNYGQLLLMKHATLLPLLWLAFSNGFLYPRYARTHNLSSQRKLLRAESMIALLVLGFTAVMGQSVPPHTVVETLRTEAPAPLFLTIFQGKFSPDLQLHWELNVSNSLLIVATLVVLYGITIAFKQRSFLWTIILSLMMILFIYLIVMFGIQAQEVEIEEAALLMLFNDSQLSLIP